MQLVMDRWQRRMVFGVMPVLLVALVVVPAVLLWGDLPSTVATRFHPDGHATGSQPRELWVAVQLVIALASAGSLVWVGRRPTPDAPMFAAAAAFIGFLTGSLWCFLTLANKGHADWHDVELGAGALFGAIGGAIGWTIPVVLMAKRIAPSRPRYDNEAIPFGPDEHPVWFGHTTSVGFGVAGAVNVALGIAIVLTNDLWVGVLMIVIGAALATFTSVVVTIDERGIAVRSGAFGWPRVRLPLDIVEEAEEVNVSAMGLGGWGYRGSLRLFKKAAWVLRKGEALQVQLRGGQRFTVSIDDADEAAAVLNGLLARAAATPRPG